MGCLRHAISLDVPGDLLRRLKLRCILPRLDEALNHEVSVLEPMRALHLEPNTSPVCRDTGVLDEV